MRFASNDRTWLPSTRIDSRRRHNRRWRRYWHRPDEFSLLRLIINLLRGLLRSKLLILHLLHALILLKTLEHVAEELRKIAFKRILLLIELLGSIVDERVSRWLFRLC